MWQPAWTQQMVPQRAIGGPSSLPASALFTGCLPGYSKTHEENSRREGWFSVQ